MKKKSIFLIRQVHQWVLQILFSGVCINRTWKYITQRMSPLYEQPEEQQSAELSHQRVMRSAVTHTDGVVYVDFFFFSTSLFLPCSRCMMAFLYHGSIAAALVLLPQPLRLNRGGSGHRLFTSCICKAKVMLIAGYNPSHELLRVVAGQLWRGRQSRALFVSYFLLRIPRCRLWPGMPLFQAGCKSFLPDSHGFDLSY